MLGRRFKGELELSLKLFKSVANVNHIVSFSFYERVKDFIKVLIASRSQLMFIRSKHLFWSLANKVEDLLKVHL